jgi:hypothetical protein
MTGSREKENVMLRERTTSSRSRLGALTALGMSCAGALVAVGSPAQAAATYAVDFATVGATTWQVPAGVTAIDVTVSGAQGGPLAGTAVLGSGGKGATVTAHLPVTPGETLDIQVGGSGGLSAGGFGGGGDGGTNSTNALLSGGGGGGASSIVRVSTGTPLVVAGGGGGAAQLLISGGASSTVGGGTAANGAGGPGAAGTPSGAGVGGVAGSWQSLAGCLIGANGTAGDAAVAGQGGSGADTSGLLTFGGGGGGGGYTGGGGGGSGATCVAGLLGLSSGGGGGGSNYLEPAATNSTVTDGAATSAGAVHLEYTDEVAPVASPTSSPTPNAQGWVRGNTTVTWNWSDALSGVDASACTLSSSVTDEGVSIATADCQDQAGNVGHATNRVQIDRTKPTVKLVKPKKATYHRGARVVAGYTCSDKLSGIASCTGTVRKGKPVNTHRLGKHTFTVTATDLAGNASKKKVTYKVVR